MPAFRILITDYGFPDVSQERAIIEAAGGSLEAAQCKTPAQVLAAARGFDGLLVQYAPVGREVIEQLEGCKVIVRYGVGYDNIDVKAARAKGILVCYVPDYCVDEVADHTMALALALARQIPFLSEGIRRGVWVKKPASPMPAFRDMTFATLGLGRVALAVLERARPFRFTLAAYDPFVDDRVFAERGIRRLSLTELFATADILSLHSPLTPETRHIINADTLGQMKPTAILINTARGPLIDTPALAEALRARRIAYAGLDVFEEEPLPAGHPLPSLENALLTPHFSFYSETSLAMLQRHAAEEVVRPFKGEKPRNPIP